MNVEIHDRGAFSRITLAGLSAYLQARGWQRLDNWQGRMIVWSCDRGEEYAELLIPIREHSSGYALRIGEAISELATWEGRSSFQVFQDLLAARADVVRFRSLNGFGGPDRSLVDGAALLDMSRDLLAAAARGADRPGEPVYRWRPSGVVTGYLREVRAVFGVDGWNDFALHSPVPADFGFQVDLGDDYSPPFSRQAMLALHQGLSQASMVRDEVMAGSDVTEMFGEAVNHGLNANLCEALAGLAERSHGVSVGLAWASVRPRGASVEDFSFSESSADVLRGGAEWLRRTSPYLNAHIVGEVVILARESDEPFDGQAVVAYELDGKPVSLHVQFPEEHRETVIRSFRNGTPVSLTGDIHREGRRYVLKSPRSVHLAPTAAVGTDPALGD